MLSHVKLYLADVQPQATTIMLNLTSGLLTANAPDNNSTISLGDCCQDNQQWSF